MNERKIGVVRWLIMTLLAWLGLAGLSDAIVEWQDWFEQDVMEHWRFVKGWVITRLLWWVPFIVPSWFIDYLVISMIVVRTSPIPRWNEHWRFGPAEAMETYGYIPFTWKMEWVMSHVFMRFPRLVLLFLMWPIALSLLLIEVITGKTLATDLDLDLRKRRSAMVSWLIGIVWCFVSFIPVLFALSTVLYKHG